MATGPVTTYYKIPNQEIVVEVIENTRPDGTKDVRTANFTADQLAMQRDAANKRFDAIQAAFTAKQ